MLCPDSEKVFCGKDFEGLSLRECFLRDFGPVTWKEAKEFEKTSLKLSKCKNHAIFNLRCKKLNVIPRSLRLSCPVKTSEGRKIVEHAGHQLVRERIRIANKHQRDLEDDRKWSEIGLRRKLGNEKFEHLNKLIEKKSEKVFLQTRKTQQSKIEKLLKERDDAKKQALPKGGNISKERWVVNMSSHKLTAEESSVLEKGLNFATVPREIPKLKIISALEPVLRNTLNKTTAEVCRAKIESILGKTERPLPNTSKQERNALRSLRTNEDIVVVPADKGNTTVILNKKDYEKKAADVIEKDPFEVVTKDPTKKVEDGLNSIVWKFFQRNLIKRPQYDYLRSSSAPLPRFYGRVKVHKPECPVRPVISAIGTATYNASKYLASVLSPLVGKEEFTTKNSKEFVEDLSEVEIEEDEIMLSYDVTALYTSLPIDRVLDVVRCKLENDVTLSERTSLGVDEVITLLEYCLKSTYFSFNGKYYHLKDGVAMGSPVSSVVANLFMENFEQKALISASNKGFAPRLWKRYVDDVFAVNKKKHADKMLQHLNQQDENIKFTYEKEEEGRLPFLDVQVNRSGRKLITSVFRKKTHTDRVLSFNSHHPLNAKRAVILSLFDRIDTHYAKDDVKGKEKERKHLFDVFKTNGYPRSFVQSTVKRASQKRTNRTVSDRPDATVSLPYVQGVNEKIARELRKVGIRVVGKAQPWTWQICTGIKDAVPVDKRKGAVYEINCVECSDSYIGETGRSFTVRRNEHQRHTKSGRFDLSAVAEHACLSGHKIDWENAKVLDFEQNWMARKTLEALHIAKRKPTLNRDCGAELSQFWLKAVDTSL